RAARPKVSARTSIFEKNLNSNDHFDRCCAPYRNEEKPPTKGKEHQSIRCLTSKKYESRHFSLHQRSSRSPRSQPCRLARRPRAGSPAPTFYPPCLRATSHPDCST